MSLIIKLRALILVLITVFFANGCATHNALQGGREPDKNSAVLYVSPIQEFVGLAHAQVLIKNLDGEPVGIIFGNRLYGAGASTIYIEPGQHTIRLRYWYSGNCYAGFCAHEKTTTLDLKFNARPGHHYHGYVRSKGDNYWAWIEDEETDEVVAGEKSPNT